MPPTDVEPIMLRTSERKSYKTCRQQWHWSFIDRLHAVQAKQALRFGDLVHQSLAAWYIPGTKRGVHPARTFERLYKKQLEEGQQQFKVWTPDEDDDWSSALDLGVGMLRHYVEHYGKDEAIKVISSEYPFELDIFDRHGRYLCTYVGKFDIVYIDLEKQLMCLMETKTAASIRTNHLPLDEQAGSYWAMAPDVLVNAGILKPGQDLDRITYNFLRKALPSDKPRDAEGHILNKDGSVSKRQPAPFFLRHPVLRDTADRANLMRRIQMEAWEMAQVRAGKLPVYKNPSGSYPDEHCNGCQFKDMCELHEAGADWTAIRDATMVTWDPYEDHHDPVMED